MGIFPIFTLDVLRLRIPIDFSKKFWYTLVTKEQKGL